MSGAVDSSSPRAPLLFVGIAVAALLLIGGGTAAALVFGERLGFASDPEPVQQLAPSSPPEETTTTREETTEPIEREKTADPSPETQDEGPSYTEPAEEFDALIPTLQEMTDAPILLPASLPDEIGGVAIESNTNSESYEILFSNEMIPGGVVQPFVNAAVGATLSAEPSGPGPQLPDYGSDVTTTRLDDVTLPDGTTAAVQYHESPLAANNNLFATGAFVREDESGEPYYYLLTVEFDSPDAEWTKEILTSLVFVEDSVQTEVPQEETFEQEFVTRYYDAVAAGDWYTTYSLLDSSSQAQFTESEWIEAQQARVSETGALPPTSATLQSASGDGAGFAGDVLLTYSDGTSETVAIQTVYEGDGLRRYLTAEDVSYLKGLIGGTEDSGSGLAGAIEQFVYEYYAAVEVEDWSQTYSMLDAGGQAAFTEAEWIERQEVRQAVSGPPSPVVDVSVVAPSSGYPPVGTATVTFASGEVVEVTVAHPHGEDAQFDRVLTSEEIEYLRSL